jgi:DNA-binding transcriptional LysR family regulator
MKIDPRHLQLLAAIVDKGGLTEGAERLGKSQPSVSRTLSDLEKRVGEPLFHPGRRPLQPTELGLALAEHGAEILRASELAEGLVDRVQSGKSGAVNVGGTPFFMDGVISSVIAEFQQTHPNVQINQSYAYADDLIPRLANGSLDLAICPMPIDAIPDELAFERILKGRNVIACRSDHPLNRKSGVKLEDISKFAWIAPPVGSPLHADLKLALSGMGLSNYKVAFSGGSLSSVVNILQGSDSLTVLPYSVVFSLQKQFDITALRVKIDHPKRDLGILRLKSNRPTPTARRFQKYIVTVFKTLARTIEHREKSALWRD